MQLARGILQNLAVWWCIYRAACVFLHPKDTSASSWAFAKSFSIEEGKEDEDAGERCLPYSDLAINILADCVNCDCGLECQ